MKNSDRRPQTILIVEDIDWIRSGMKSAVERFGYRAAEATDATDAFKSAELESIELILTEEQLPTFDALMARLREHPALSNVPVVIVNPDAEEGTRLSDAYLLTDYAHIPSLLAGLRR
ncbi:MAG: response regulator [Pyrinomonadaceae bacterium]|nr:response regulator [Pyrinomonadaceae bacterium]